MSGCLRRWSCPGRSRCGGKERVTAELVSGNYFTLLGVRPEAADDSGKTLPPEEDKPDTNEVQHHPDPKAEPIPGVDHKYHPKSPYTGGSY